MAIARRRPLAVVFVIVLASLLSACGVNTIPTYAGQAKAAWSEVLNQSQQRADLIPKLVEAVKGYAPQEEKVLAEVTDARARATRLQIPADILTNPEAFAGFQAAQGAVGAALSRLMAIAEAYPDLKSNQNFRALQSQLEGTESRIAVARRDYIEAVRLLNAELRTIPGSWWNALLYGNRPMETFTVPDDKAQAPGVKVN